MEGEEERSPPRKLGRVGWKEVPVDKLLPADKLHAKLRGRPTHDDLHKAGILDTSHSMAHGEAKELLLNWKKRGQDL